MFEPKLYTVESVTSGHPDKMCDQISDAILDACLTQDPQSRVAVETFGSHGLLVIGGEVTTRAEVDYEAIARSVYDEIGYQDELKVVVNISRQSPDIAQGVDSGGAGDQGIMYGYATQETREFLPRGVVLVHALTKGLERLRREGKIPWLRPDGKAQVTLREGRVRSVLVSCQHADGVPQAEIRQVIIDFLIAPLLGDLEGVEILVNPTGNFVRGGFEADTGLTGRKIMVDTYGGLIPHGGGCFSGKDATKVDRSAAYMARFAAKNIVANGLTEQCLVSVAYAIGRAEPLMVQALDERGEEISEDIVRKFDFRPSAIIERLELRRPLYLSTASYGHFGKSNLPWEKVEAW
ncbi:MAG: methionine adenosyltransferase [Candidatus Wildermuthbacteria bacterium RIFCSPLOWO2_02_FULL_47_9c]|uniref:Methionine adenosyltransferase n=2 Tax=Parcubacteria group TaxID=1794811 RepID=A0A837IR18_9BACT|nr:MAG: S-adenosylmethionine synthase [Candidatus Yanofskybacteria bacterium GW2011_GWC1_48_11]KKW03986.1 MAG: S-adenosylmethionine synthase [Parcubacteria group bacterium GW2011_GWB1_49_12]KKW08912.1 MAG: S-adenosylmethionine synthase [Parcubacteria group bacterium GW2011_GWA1_49_26]OHA61828.1 MAG: methionine adenosyltransferase [Candidatus Wildermuthbacteria bacterium GWA1_49_26]OHA65338.1 MAG: methionine adenosyltransferase [Candidatus Wildermuthbacteria bacterium RIFCSPHIGHO2_01_FULL_50_47]